MRKHIKACDLKAGQTIYQAATITTHAPIYVMQGMETIGTMTQHQYALAKPRRMRRPGYYLGIMDTVI